MRAIAEEALAADDPGQAFFDFIRRIGELGMCTPGLHECVVHCGEKPGAAELEELGAEIVARAQRAGARATRREAGGRRLLVRAALTARAAGAVAALPRGRPRRLCARRVRGMTELVRPQRPRRSKWRDCGPRGFVAELVDDDDAQVGVNLFVLEPGQPMAMYHWEADQEGFLVLSGEAMLIIDGEERTIRAVGLRPLPAGRPAHRSSAPARGRA